MINLELDVMRFLVVKFNRSKLAGGLELLLELLDAIFLVPNLPMGDLAFSVAVVCSTAFRTTQWLLRR